VNHHDNDKVLTTTSSCIPSFVSRTSRAPVIVSARPTLILTIPTSTVLPPAIAVPRLFDLLPPAAAPAFVIHIRIEVAVRSVNNLGSAGRPADAKSDPISVSVRTAAAAAATTTTATSGVAISVSVSVSVPIPIVVSTPFPANTITFVRSVSVPVPSIVVTSSAVSISRMRTTVVAVTARTAIDEGNVIVVVVVVAPHGHALEQARLAMRGRRGVVALPSSSESYLRVFLPPAAAVTTATATTRTAAAAAAASAATTGTVVPGGVRISISRRAATAVAAAAAAVSSVLEPVGRVVALAFLELERALLHSQAVLVARALADVYRGAPAPAVAERLVVFPVARPAGVHWP